MNKSIKKRFICKLYVCVPLSITAKIRFWGNEILLLKNFEEYLYEIPIFKWLKEQLVNL